MAAGALHQGPGIFPGLDAVKFKAFFYQLPDGLVPLGRRLFAGRGSGLRRE